MEKVSVIIPTFNEALGIVTFIKRILRVFSKISQQYKLEIIIIDDNSPDNTGKIVKKKFLKDKRIRVFIRKNISGLGTAIGYGVKKAKGDIIIGIDADGNHDEIVIPALLKNLDQFDLVIASRFIKGGGLEKKTDIFRHLVSFFINLFFKIFGSPVWDSTSGFYVIRKKKLKALGLGKIYYGYGDYHLRLVCLAKSHKYLIKEIPYTYKKRIAGKSKSNLFKMFFSYLLEGVKIKLK
ncbi:hypothetical protein COT75_01280 [Candidatus Beckwithbacteria bacterium CG10_big_fil_rev_8_21_14_0_10_34_10]|uniref:Glycosyltransferase 2-like domain-containing protein n=1 Tax=Candidatus Beckwithbacteria bacterium CG10_big_fil_rev_8_21_14_0_10_34_10 TaxID=1974495 RepID=A0A2H0WA04_9BACT|nr:MAG: hypothetical protein COT75_01280 [Candidatus Beckwithbacteria bacterium CG10_big_fil_rev_8_21_14_0_10_34_10]